MQADHQQFVVSAPDKDDGDEKEQNHGSQFDFVDGENVAEEITLQVATESTAGGDNRNPERNDGRKEDPDNRVGGKFGMSFNFDNNPGIQAEEKPEGNAGESGVADGIGKKSHPEVDYHNTDSAAEKG